MNVPMLALVWLAFGKLDALPRNSADLAATGGSVLKTALKSKAVWTLSIFLMLYVG